MTNYKKEYRTHSSSSAMNWRETFTAESVVLKAWLCFHAFQFASYGPFSSVAAAEKSDLTDNADSAAKNSSVLPLAINTWGFSNATESARAALVNGGSARDAVEAAGTRCELDQCDFTVGYGGSPDERGETTLDAMVMEGASLNVGAVGALRGVKNAIGVARAVLERTRHSLLVGDQATDFAVQMGFPVEDLRTTVSIRKWRKWKDGGCQPNFWKNVSPDPQRECGPHHPLRLKYTDDSSSSSSSPPPSIASDTIGVVVIDTNHHVEAGTSTNGANHKIPGRVGDSPIPGSGAYADDEAGGAVATGDGDVMMRFLPAYQAVENLRRGMEPEEAAADVVKRIVKRHPEFEGGVVVADRSGKFGAACHGFSSGRFPYSVWHPALGAVTVKWVNCQ